MVKSQAATPVVKLAARMNEVTLQETVQVKLRIRTVAHLRSEERSTSMVSWMERLLQRETGLFSRKSGLTKDYWELSKASKVRVRQDAQPRGVFALFSRSQLPIEVLPVTPGQNL